MRLGNAKKLLHAPLFWLVLACIPATILFANRFLVPDLSTDTISYHLFNGAEGAHSLTVPFSQHEFYPVGIMSLNAGYDTLQYGVRLILGYRLGTVVSLLAMIGIIVVLYKLLRLILSEQRKTFHAGWGLLLVSSGVVLELYFQLATYFVDIINALAVLLVFYLILKRVTLAKTVPKPWFWVVLWLLLGLLVTLKLTNLALVIPLAGLLLWVVWKRGQKSWKHRLLYAACTLVFFLPLMPQWIHNYALTNNPVFPFYNATFQSPDYPSINFTDPFGTHNVFEKLVWPLASAREQVRLAEPHHIYNDYKMALQWICGLVLLGLLFSKKIRLGSSQKTILYYFLSSLLIWGMLFGIARYAVSTLALGGLVIAMLFAADYRRFSKATKRLLLALAIIVCGLLLIENIRIFRFNLQYDMSWRPSIFNATTIHREQLGSLFQKQLHVTSEQQKIIVGADILLNCHVNVTGWLTMLPGTKDKPTVNIIADQLPFYGNLSNNKNYQHAVKDRLQTAYPGKTTYTFVTVISDDFGPTKPNCLNAISDRGGRVHTTTPIDSILGYKGNHLLLANGTITL